MLIYKKLIMAGKFHVLTNVVFDNILHDNDYAEYPFDVSSKEIRIIRHFKTAAFVLGRSGTGKTTCLVYKLLSRYLASAQYVGTENRLRQVCKPCKLMFDCYIDIRYGVTISKPSQLTLTIDGIFIGPIDKVRTPCTQIET